MPSPKLDELRDRLRRCLRPPKDQQMTLEQTAVEMRDISARCKELGLNYNKLLTEVCQALSAERKEER